METNEAFPVALRELLIEHDYTTSSGRPNWAAFAARLDVHYETLRRAVAGERPPTARLMEACALALSIRPEYFLEYRAYLARRDFDPNEVGLEQVIRNLHAWTAALAEGAGGGRRL